LLLFLQKKKTLPSYNLPSMEDPAEIATHYRLDHTKPATTLAGQRCFTAIDQRDATRALIALQVTPFEPPRAKLLGARALSPIPHAMMPLDHGAGRDPAGAPGWFMICPAPPGPPLSAAPAPWSEAEIVTCLLLPAAQALEALAEQDLTHRAIRPDNIFRAGRGTRAILGPCWAAPPASHQPIAFEPPYIAMCPPHARGEGSIADDIYALGVSMLWCALGGQVAWPETPALLTRKLEAGSFEALAGGRALSPALADLLRVMLAEDPDHRPSPSLLQDPTQARARRLAQRPPQRAQRPIDISGISAWSSRELALALARVPEAGGAALKSGAVDRWLRRILGDSQMAVAVDDAVFRHGADPEEEDARTQPAQIMRAIATLDPLAPLVWRGQAWMPDGIPGAAAACLAPDKAVLAAALEELVAFDIVTQWAAPQPRRRAEVSSLAQQSKDWRRVMTMRGPMGGLRRLAYTLNPLLACASPRLGGRIAIKLPALLPALEQAAKTADRKQPPLDAHLIAFIAAHADSPLLSQLSAVEGIASSKERLAVLAMYARLQHLLHPAPLPGLAAWLLESELVELESWRNLHTRKSLADALDEAARSGQIGAMQMLMRNDSAHAADRDGAARAEARLAAIKSELAALRHGTAQRATEAQRTGQDVASGLGLIAAIAAASLLALAG
jgi:hypothetical protein